MSCIAALWIGLGSAPARAEDPITGLSTDVTGPISGRVTEGNGAPLKDLEVHVSTAEGTQVVRTDHEGRFRIDLKDIPGTKTVFVYGILRLTLEKLTETTFEGLEAVDIQESSLPKVMPRPLVDRVRLPAITEAARRANVWIRAWLVLEIGVTGAVTRVKLLNPPGYGLEEATLREAYKLRFEPARDASGRATVASVLWKYDWPAYSWMMRHRFDLEWLPPEASSIGCKDESMVREAYRDCTPANIAAVQTQPWLPRPADLPVFESQSDVSQASPPPARARWYHSKLGWLVTGTGASMLLTTGYLYVGGRRLQREADAATNDGARDIKQRDADARRLNTYIFAVLGLAITGYGVSLFVTHGDDSSSVAVAGRF